MSEYTARHAQAGGETPPLEAWPNQYADRDYTIEIKAPEFTCVCPRTGLPDFAVITIRYVPDQTCIELKSLKYYLNTFRDQGIFHENVVNRVRDDIIAAVRPRHLEVKADFGVRGGLHTSVQVEWTASGSSDND